MGSFSSGILAVALSCLQNAHVVEGHSGTGISIK